MTDDSKLARKIWKLLLDAGAPGGMPTAQSIRHYRVPVVFDADGPCLTLELRSRVGTLGYVRYSPYGGAFISRIVSPYGRAMDDLDRPALTRAVRAFLRSQGIATTAARRSA